jgi:hypothetical protein
MSSSGGSSFYNGTYTTMLPAGGQDCVSARFARAHVTIATDQANSPVSEIHKMFNRSAHASCVI